MQCHRDIEIQQIRLFDVLTPQVVSIVGFEAIDDFIEMGLQIIHDLLQHMFAPDLAGFSRMAQTWSIGLKEKGNQPNPHPNFW